MALSGFGMSSVLSSKPFQCIGFQSICSAQHASDMPANLRRLLMQHDEPPDLLIIEPNLAKLQHDEYLTCLTRITLRLTTSSIGS